MHLGSNTKVNEQGVSVRLIERTPPSGPAAHGVEVLVSTFEGLNIRVSRSRFTTSRRLPDTNQNEDMPVLLVGLMRDPVVRGLFTVPPSAEQMSAESFTVQTIRVASNADSLVVAGADDRGLMYALLEIAEKVRAHGISALGSFASVSEHPDSRIRGVYRFLMGKLDNSWYESEDFWRYYFSRLAAARFNRFVLVLGFDTGYLSPPYPFFVRTGAFPAVRAAGLSDDDVARNLAHLNRIITLAHEYGLEFILGTWQQKPWLTSEGVQVERLPDNDADLADYCVEAVKELLRGLPELDGIHFRVNHEAGVGTQTSNELFWRRMTEAVAEVRPDIKYELRAKGLTDSMIADALNVGLNLTVPTKYWCEHAGLPYHLTQMRSEELSQLENLNHSRRYSYADMLKRPRSYDIIYRLWNNGTTTFLLWSDPDYVRRFVESCHLGGAAGFEVAAPLSLQWGHSALQGEAWRVYTDPSLRCGTWEDERYWLFYTLFGRIGYRHTLEPDVWEREIALRFGAEALEALRQAFASSGKILPLITAFHMPVHPQLVYWPEVSTGAALFAENNHRQYIYRGHEITYASAEPSDPGLFYGIDEWVAHEETGGFFPRYSPLQVSVWLENLSRATRVAVSALDRAPTAGPNAEVSAMREDFLMLCDIAEFHAHKVRAAVEVCRFGRSHGTARIHAAAGHMNRAAIAWRSLAERGARFYHENLVFQAGGLTGGRMGHWRDWTKEVEADLGKLQSMIEGDETTPLEREQQRSGGASSTFAAASHRAIVPARVRAGSALRLDLLFDRGNFGDEKWVLLFRHANQMEGPFRSMPANETATGVQATISAEYVVPEWDILAYFACTDGNGATTMVPGLFSSEEAMPYFVISVV